MRAIRLLPLALLALLHAPGARSQCAEPSALDLDPMVEPLRVEKDASDDLRVSWEAVMADGYRLHRGRLDRLHVNQSYDHRVIAEPTDAETIVEELEGNWYFLVASDCRASDSGVGRDSADVERPFGGLISVRIGIQGGTEVSGTQFTLAHPAATSFTDDDGVSFLGPYGGGGVFTAENTSEVGLVTAAAALVGMSFDPPPDMPMDVAEVLFGYHGVPPAAGEFWLQDCRSSDVVGNPLPSVECTISGFDVLF